MVKEMREGEIQVAGRALPYVGISASWSSGTKYIQLALNLNIIKFSLRLVARHITQTLYSMKKLSSATSSSVEKHIYIR